jgi:predicted nucleotidyltransferase
MGPLQELAVELGADERTLRRAAAQGALLARRVGPRRLRLAPGEIEYLRERWQLLASLRRALRTERGVRLAVLYGSVARGDEDSGSDLDLLVSLSDRDAAAVAGVARSLGHLTSRRIDVVDLERVEANAPLLLDRVLEEGRVLVDRDDRWRQLRDRRRAIRGRAQRAHRRQMTDAAGAIAELSR